MTCCCICCWRFCAWLTLSPFSWVFLAHRPYRCSFGLSVTQDDLYASKAGAGWASPRLIPRLRIRGGLHVADRDLSPDPGAFHLGEVHTQLLGLTLGGLSGVGLFLPGRILGLLSGLTGGILRALRGLPGLVGNLTCGVLGLSGRLTGGILDALHGLPGLVRHLAQGALVLLALLLRTGVGLVAGVFDRLRSLRRRRDLQVQHATVRAELKLQERPGLVGHGGRLVALFVGGHLVAFGRRQVGGVAHRALVYYVALLVEDHLDQVAFLVDGALDGMAFLVGGGIAERLGARGETASHLADLVHRPSRGVLNLVNGLTRGVSYLPGDLPDLICHSSQQVPALLVLLVLSAFAHLLSSLLESLLSCLAPRIARVTLASLPCPSFRPRRWLVHYRAARRFST